VSSGMDLTDESDPSRRLIRQVLGAVAEHDKACLVAKLRKARERMRVASGRCEGRKPYGTRVGEDRGLERIRTLVGEGYSVRAISDRLNAEGIPSRGGKAWSFGSVADRLNAEGIPSRGGKAWSFGSVARVAKRLKVA
ncbi:MAG: hypothetical protein EBU85_06845, partial [Actinobacteria bacterium]|nr:hypothetical protein [Actinomycetota bacterium]